MKLEVNSEDYVVKGAIKKLRVLNKAEPLASRGNDRLIGNIIAYNQLIQAAVKPAIKAEDSDREELIREDSGEFEERFEQGSKEVLAALNRGNQSVKKRNLEEAIARFEALERTGAPEGRYFKGMVMMAQNPANFFAGLSEMVEATRETMSEVFLANLKKILEFAQKNSLFQKVKAFRLAVDRNKLGTYLVLFLKAGNHRDQETGAAMLLEALRKYYSD